MEKAGGSEPAFSVRHLRLVKSQTHANLQMSKVLGTIIHDLQEMTIVPTNW